MGASSSRKAWMRMKKALLNHEHVQSAVIQQTYLAAT